ncbi:hypothetical protein ABK040_006835 [Willaertia magna]
MPVKSSTKKAKKATSKKTETTKKRGKELQKSQSLILEEDVISMDEEDEVEQERTVAEEEPIKKKKKENNKLETETIKNHEKENIVTTLENDCFIVVDVFSNKQKSIPKKRISNVNQLKQAICEAFKITIEDIDSIRNLDDKVIENENLTEGFDVINLTTKSSGKINGSVSIPVDIVPHVNILTHGGDEYDFTMALAEIIDNSIQNTISNVGERVIEIKLVKPNENNGFGKLHIWDNGRGMNFQTLKHWATMGISDPPSMIEDKVTSKKKNDKYVTSDFSRYGVGSKKAIFNIGDEVTMITKPKDSRFVYEVSLSRSRLENDFKDKEKQWRANIQSRPPSENEKHWESFTHVIISEVKEYYIAQYETLAVKRKLAHLYHYYIFGVGGNKVAKKNDKDLDTLEDTQMNDKQDNEDEIEDEEDDFQSGPKNVRILVDGTKIDGTENDMETQYLSYGHNPFHFSIKVQEVLRGLESLTEPSQLSSSSQSNKHLICSIVKGIIYYYPFKGGKETLPIPDDIFEGRLPTEDIQLGEREPGLECFWNGRLIAREKIRSLQFMEKDRSNKEIPDNCYRRIKGMLFFDSNFPVSQNKMNMVKSQLYENFNAYEDRQLTLKFRKWIKECHKKFDEEIIFEETDLDRNNKEGKGIKSFYKKVRYGSQPFELGDRVALRTRPKILGTITDMFRDLTSEEYSVTILVKEWCAESDEEVTAHPLSKVQSVLTKQEYKKEIDKLKNKNPSAIEIVETPGKVMLKEKRPPSDPVQAGFTLKWLSAAIMSGDRKIVNKPLPIILRISYEGNDEKEKEFKAEIVSDKPYKNGVHCFKPVDRKKKFTIVGTYVFELKSSEKGVKSKTYRLEVKPGPPSNIKLNQPLPCIKEVAEDSENAVTFFIGKPLDPFEIFQTDYYDNDVPFAVGVEGLNISCEDDNIVLSKYSAVINENNRILISDLMVEKANIGEDKCIQTKLIITYGQLEDPLRLDMFIFAGEPEAFTLTEDSKNLIGNNTIRRVFPQIELKLLDSFGNQVYRATSYGKGTLSATAKGDDIKEEYNVKIDPETGLFIFKGITLSESLNPSQRTDATVRVELDRNPDIFCSIGGLIEASSAIRVANMRLVIPDNLNDSVTKEGTEQPTKVTLQSVVGTDITGLQLRLEDEMYELLQFNGYAVASWSNSPLKISNGLVDLPSLVCPTTEKVVKSNVRIYTKEPKESIEEDTCDQVTRFDIVNRCIFGPPISLVFSSEIQKFVSCDKAISFQVDMKDLYGNILKSTLYEEKYPIIKQIEPILEIEEIEPTEEKQITFTKEPTLTRGDCGFKYKNVQIGGICGEFNLILKDKSGTIKAVSKVENILLEPGKPEHLRVNDDKTATCIVENFGLTPPFSVTVHDKYGNNIQNSNIQFEIDAHENLDMAQVDGVSHSIELGVDNGRATLPNFCIRAFPGEYYFHINAPENSNIEKATVFITVVKGCHPTELEIINKVTSLSAGDMMKALEVMVKGENGKAVKPPAQIDLEVIYPEQKSKRNYVPSLMSSQTYTYQFMDTERQMTQAGTYRFKFTLNLTDLDYFKCFPENAPTFPVLEETLERVLSVAVEPGPPAKLEIENDEFQLPVVTNSATDIDKRSFWEELSLKVIDEYGNTVHADQAVGVVSIEIRPGPENEDNAPPELDGDLETEFVNGRAKFGRLSVKEGSGDSGVYRLVFVSNTLPPKEFEFAFTDDAKVQEEEKRLQQKRKSIQQEQDNIKSEIERAEEIHRENELKLQNLKNILHELTKELEEDGLEHNWEDIPKLESVFAMFKKKLSIMKQNATKNRECNVGAAENQLLSKVKNIIETQTSDASGIIGILGELGFVDRSEIDATISKQLGGLMQAVIVQNKSVADKLRQMFEKSPHKAPILPFDNFRPSIPLDSNGLIKLNPIKAEGFIGYACNLIQIPDKNEQIRFVFHLLLGNTLVFDTYENGYQFRNSKIQNNESCPLIITLDNDRIESSGIVFAGAKTDGVKFRFGQIPYTETPEYKKLLRQRTKLKEYIDKYKEMEEFEKNEFSQTEQELTEIRDKYNKVMQSINRELKKVDEEISNLRQGLISNKKRKGPLVDSPSKEIEPRTPTKKKITTMGGSKKSSPSKSPALFSSLSSSQSTPVSSQKSSQRSSKESSKSNGSSKKSSKKSKSSSKSSSQLSQVLGDDEIEEYPVEEEDEIENFTDDEEENHKKRKKSPSQSSSQTKKRKSKETKETKEKKKSSKKK